MKRSFLNILAAVLAAGGVSYGQTGSSVLGSGYSAPTPLAAAPGEIMNLFVAGVGSGLTQRVVATTLPLPTMLGGISVTMTQAEGTPLVAIPLLAVSPMSTCLHGSAPQCGSYAVITMEVPFELEANLQGPVGRFNTARFVVSENGIAGGAVDVNPVTNQVHVLNTCDINTGAAVGCIPAPVIAHGDGTLVSNANPAKTGEELVLYAFGLGTTTPPVVTGEATPSPGARVDGAFRINFDFRPDVDPSRPALFPIVCEAIRVCPDDPLYAGLTAGYVGLYQVNFVVPPFPDPMLYDCTGGAFASNLTVTVYSLDRVSYDGAGICVWGGL